MSCLGSSHSPDVVTGLLSAYPGQSVAHLSAWKVLLAGGCAGLGFWGPTYPLDVIKSTIQADSPDPAKRRFRTMGDAARHIYSTHGLGGFYKGVTPCLIRAFPANAAAWGGLEFTLRAFERAGL